MRLTLVGTGITLPSVGASARRYNLATACLEASLRADPRLEGRLEVERLDLDLSLDTPSFAPALVDRVLATEPDWLGLSCYCWDLPAQLELARAVKARRPRIRVVLGGPSASIQDQAILADEPAVDVVVRGEGEQTLAELLALEGPEGVAGLSFRDRGGELQVNPDRPLAVDLDELPSPLLSGVLRPPEENLLLELSRGCRYRCAYCAWKLRGGRVRRKSPARVEAELAWAVSAGYRHAFVIDAALNGDEEHLAAVAGALERVDPGRQLALSYFIDAALFTDEQARHLEALRTHEVTVGLESTNAAALRAVGRRPLDRDAFERAVHRLSTQAPVTLSIILGLPGDSLAGFRQTLDDCAALAERARLRSVRVFWMMVAPGSALARRAEKLHLELAPEGVPYLLGSPTFPRADLAEAVAALRSHPRADLFLWDDADPAALLGSAPGAHLVPPVTAEQVLRMLSPLTPGRTLKGRYTLSPLGERDGHPVVTITGDDGAPLAQLQLRPRGAEARPLARTRSFDLIWIAPPEDHRHREAEALIHTLIRLIERKDR